MSAGPDVSVIIPVYNAAEYLERCVGSVLRQTIGQDRIQCIIVDDGSTDGSGDILDRMAGEHPLIEVFHQPNSGGPAHPRNYALDRVRGRYIFFLDQDDYLSDDALRAMVEVADANGTDVVLPRMQGVGGRGAPLVMYTRTIPRTNVYSSSAYWTLSPIKLFRTSLVRSLGIHFDEAFPVHEDVGFVTMAYVHADGISILADRDYVYWAHRADGSNITLNRMTLADRLPGATNVVDLLAREVPPGPKRDTLMRRLFEIEVLGSMFKAYRDDPDHSLRPEAFTTFRRLVAEYYTPELDRQFLPRGRVAVHLIRRNDPTAFLEFLEAVATIPHPPTELIEGEHVYLQLPWFRDGAHDIPDELFDIAPALRVFCRSDPIVVGHRGLEVSLICRLGSLTDRITAVSIVAKQRGGGLDERVFPLRCDLDATQASPAMPAWGTLPGSELLSLPVKKTYDLYVRVEAGRVARERRLVEDARAPRSRVFRGIDTSGQMRFGLITSTKQDEVSVRVLTPMAMARRAIRRRARSILRLLRTTVRTASGRDAPKS